MRALALALVGAVVVQTPAAPVEYRFSEVVSKVVLTHLDTGRQVAAGDAATAGDEVRTGWRGRAVVEAPAAASRFEILPSTRARLAGPEPGVLLVLERGRVKAIFDALTGNDGERLVATPGALLAVRGTRYGVEVDADGAAAVTVFDGTVEVLPRAAGVAPLAVRAGEVCTFGPHTPPHSAPAPRGTREEEWHGGMVERAPRGAEREGGPERGAPGAQGPTPGHPDTQQRPPAQGSHGPGGGSI
jgi:hypothetical protein